MMTFSAFGVVLLDVPPPVVSGDSPLMLGVAAFGGALLAGIIAYVLGKKSALAAFGGESGFALGKKVALKAGADAEFAKKLEHLFNPPPVKPSGEAIRLLGLLQRDARLLDFLMENLGAYTDDQIGASVRDIQAKCQTVLKKNLVLEPVMSQPEGSRVSVPAGFDPSAIVVTGNVSGQPPFQGTLQHGGWRVKTINIPKTPEGHDEMVLMPAEVEI